jgi:hypothetical protein
MSETLSPKQEKTAFALLFSVAILMMIVVPLIVLWALNTLFPSLAIPTNFSTWVAALVVLMFLHPKTTTMVTCMNNE